MTAINIENMSNAEVKSLAIQKLHNDLTLINVYRELTLQIIEEFNRVLNRSNINWKAVYSFLIEFKSEILNFIRDEDFIDEIDRTLSINEAQREILDRSDMISRNALLRSFKDIHFIV